MTRVWTAHEDRTIARMAGDGSSAQQIADALGSTRNAVIGRAYRRDIKLGPVSSSGLTAGQVLLIRSSPDVPDREFSRRFGVSHVSIWKARMGVTHRNLRA